jgi:secreted trypsin-like serine protease
MNTLDTDYLYEKNKKYDLQSWPNCGLNRFSSRPGEIKLKRTLRTFQEYISDLSQSIKEVRRSRERANSGKNLDVDGRIVGGKPVEAGRWPWLAAVGKYDETPFCGATVIRDRWLISAAHCFEDEVKPCRFTVRVGATDWLTDPENLSQDSGVEAIYRHPKYDAETHANDIALIKLSSPLSLDSDTNLNAICLPKKARSVRPGTTLFAAGWGVQGPGAPSTVPMEASQIELPLIGYEGTQCGEYPDEMIMDGMVCAGYTQGGKDTCQGDSGGPLIYKKDDKWYQLGATSFGIGCAQKGWPGIYADVGRYLNWIASCIHRNS